MYSNATINKLLMKTSYICAFKHRMDGDTISGIQVEGHVSGFEGPSDTWGSTWLVVVHNTLPDRANCPNRNVFVDNINLDDGLDKETQFGCSFYDFLFGDEYFCGRCLKFLIS